MIKSNYNKLGKDINYIVGIPRVPVQQGLALTGSEAYQRSLSGAPLPEGMDTLFNEKLVDDAKLPDFDSQLDAGITTFEIMDRALANKNYAHSILDTGREVLRRDLRKKNYETAYEAGKNSASEG